MTALLIAVVAMGMVAVQPAAATGASTQTTDQAEFGNVTAEVTKETLFTGKVSKVKVTFEAPDGEQVTIDVAGDTETVTATGSEQSVTERVGAFFFFGEHYPVDVSASIQGGESVDGTINEDDGVVTLKSVDGEPEPEDSTISGTVTDDSGNALSDAEVTADGQSTTTASDGSYSLTVAPGDYTVEASADGYVSDSQPVTVTEGDTTTADFSLTEEVPDNGTISGVVEDANGNALSGATVTTDGQSTTTASDGSYSLTVAPGDYTVEASADGYVSDTQSVTVTEGGTATADFALDEVQPDDGTITGTVTDDSGNALSGAMVTAGSQSATTDSSGSYTLTVAPGDYTVEANADGYQSDSQQVSVSPGGSATADFSLTAEDGTISGVVEDESGNGLSDAEVTAGSQSTTTASDGSYSLTVAPGDYTVEANADGYQSDSADVTVTAGETTPADFSLPEEGPTYQSFTAYTEDGYISVGTEDNAGYGEIPHCPQGEAQTDKGCVYFNASFNQSTGEYTVAPEDFIFPTINFTSETLDQVPTNNTASDTITGSLNTETGESTFNAPIFAELELGTEGCGIPVNVAGTTGQSGNLTGSPADPATFDQNGTAEATLVDNELQVPATEGCGILGGTVDGDVGLPAPSGENEVVLELYIEFHEEPLN